MSGFSRRCLAAAAILLISTELHAAARVYLLSASRGVMYSENAGRAWKDANRGLPPRCRPTALRSGPAGRLYLLTLDAGLYTSDGRGGPWVSLNTDAFRSRSLTAPDGAMRTISAFAADPSDPRRLLAATKHSLYKSDDGGRHWSALRGPRGNSNYFTSLAFTEREGLYLAGTSLNGLYRLGDGSLARSAGLPREPYTGSMFFYEEISALAVDRGRPGTWYAGLAFGKGIYVSRDGGGRWVPLKMPADLSGHYAVHDLAVSGDSLYVSAGPSLLRLHVPTGTWYGVNIGPILENARKIDSVHALLVADDNGAHPPLLNILASSGPGRLSPPAPSADKRRGIYAGVPVARKKLSSLIAGMKRHGLNALTIDMKDDFGLVHFPTDNATAREIGALRRSLDVRSVLDRLKKEGIYTIARVVVFKDQRLYRAYDHRYAIWNGRIGGPWKGSPGEYWVDPHSEFVHNYHIELSRDLERLGFDEIQFDYIRFPSDGPVHQCLYRYRKDGETYKSEALVDFLTRAKHSLKVPVSVDIYGFNGWYRFGNSIGQDIEAFARVVDVICPMVYPSHFGSRFYRSYPGNEHPYRVVLDSGLRSRALAGDGVFLRPYLQAFKMLSPTWGPGYITAQIKGAEESGSNGYTFWNAKGEYDMLYRGLKK
ncbi:MAG TPA: hypothetical protein ENN21_09400 [Spirochaetes bacterium]|nr:hypothetical protein [Spirochaetota bacterium]